MDKETNPTRKESGSLGTQFNLAFCTALTRVEDHEVAGGTDEDFLEEGCWQQPIRVGPGHTAPRIDRGQKDHLADHV